MSHSPAVETSRAEPNLVPLLDVVLQLIMFFMLTVNFVRTGQINPEIILPTSESGVPPDKSVEEVLYLNMNYKGQLLVAGERLDTDSQIKAYLTREKQRAERHIGQNHPEKFMVVLRAHKWADWKHIARICQACIDVGITNYDTRSISKATST
jgi:biopolymer transport protein ExbD